MFDETRSLQPESNRCTPKQFVRKINDVERASYNGSIEASQASDVGSIPIARSKNTVCTVRRDPLQNVPETTYTFGPKGFSKAGAT